MKTFFQSRRGRIAPNTLLAGLRPLAIALPDFAIVHQLYFALIMPPAEWSTYTLRGTLTFLYQGHELLKLWRSWTDQNYEWSCSDGLNWASLNSAVGNESQQITGFPSSSISERPTADILPRPEQFGGTDGLQFDTILLAAETPSVYHRFTVDCSPWIYRGPLDTVEFNFYQPGYSQGQLEAFLAVKSFGG